MDPPSIPTEQVSLEETVALFMQIKKLYESVKVARENINIDKSIGP